MERVVMKIYDDEGRTKIPAVVMKQLGLTKGSMLVVEAIAGDRVVLRKLPSPEERLGKLGPRLPEGVDEDRVFEELDLEVYSLA